MHIDSDASDTEGEQNTQTVSGVTYKPRVACLQERRLESITRSTASLLTSEIKFDCWDWREEPLVTPTL
ncbi:rCG26156 [Rattus norvegicus]|uniref:RCG26156 n=1 Tax=Rattus norvegicus TaxID=10116 RepID=A6HPA3_RAT|nr:rCG26156 [Rattus norvegicus]